METEDRLQKTEQIQTDYHLNRIKNITPQSYRINPDELKAYYETPFFALPVKLAKAGFDNFNAYNTELKMAVDKLKQWDGAGLVCLLNNSTGTGKTHLSIATAREYFRKVIYKWIDDNADIDFGYKDYAQADFNEMLNRNAPLFFTESETWKNDYGNIEFNFWLKINRVVIIDDLFAGKQSETSRAAIYEIINTRLTNYNLPTIITSNLTLDGISKIDERIASRLQSEYTFELTTTGDYRAKGSMQYD